MLITSGGHKTRRRIDRRKEDEMRKLALFAALAALAIAVPLSFGSSHREAPLTSIDPTGDDTDTYAFTAQDAPGSLTIVGNWVPFEDPAGGPNFYKFDDNAHYYLNIDNTGDGVADVRYLFDFDTKVRNPNSFLYTNGQPVDSVDSQNRNVVQTYSVTRVADGHSEVIARERSDAAEQRRAEDHSRLPGGPSGRDQEPARRRQGVRRPARGPVLRLAGADLRHGQPDRSRPGQPGRWGR